MKETNIMHQAVDEYLFMFFMPEGNSDGSHISIIPITESTYDYILTELGCEVKRYRNYGTIIPKEPA